MPATFVIAVLADLGLAAVLVLALRARGSMAAWSAAFAGTLVVWTTADAVHDLGGPPAWHVLDVTVSPLSLPIGLHFAASFAGRTRELRGWLALSWVWFGALGVSSAMAFGGEPLLDEAPWTIAFLIGLAGCATLTTVQIGRVWKRSGTADERARARLLLVALPFAATFGATDLLETFIPGLPMLAPIGVLGSAVAMTTVAVRWRLFGRDLSTASAVQAALVASSAVATTLVAARVLAGSTAALALVVGSVIVAVVVATRHVVVEAAMVRARRTELQHLGHAAAQMAHDLKNPIAAIRGAADVLVEELRRGAKGPPEELLELATGIRDDADRLARLVDDYRRFVRVEAVPTGVDVGPWLAGWGASAARGAPVGAVVVIELPPAPLHARWDADLVTQVVDNLLRNAFEALDGRPGQVTVRAAAATRGDKLGAILVVDDDGPGMDEATRARATDDFFTTKASGSGLGLSFARRVAEAHGGGLEVRPREGGGTVVELWVPAAAAR